MLNGEGSMVKRPIFLPQPRRRNRISGSVSIGAVLSSMRNVLRLFDGDIHEHSIVRLDRVRECKNYEMVNLSKFGRMIPASLSS